MARILISAGHTVMDPGAIFKDLREGDLTRKIAQKVIPYLEKAKVEVQAVPLDLPLFQRIEWINDTGYTAEQGDLLVEMHVNDADGTKRGIECWYEANGDNPSQKLAAVLQDTLCADLKYDSQGIKSEFEHELGMLTFLNRTNPAAVIAETLFMDNAEDIEILKDDEKLDELAKHVAKAILRYLGKALDGKDLPEEQKPDISKLVAKYSTPKAIDASTEGTTATQETLPARTALPMPTPNPLSGIGNFGDDFGGALKPGFGGLGSNLGGAGNAASNMMQDREQRKKMIEDYYRKILGRKPNPTDLNYFLNKGTNEIELVKKMVESQEHAEILKSKKELEELKKKLEKLEIENKRLTTGTNDMRRMLDNLNKLISHKNETIRRLESIVEKKHGVPSQVFQMQQQARVNSNPTPATTTSPKVKSKITDRMFGFLSRRVG
jgi:uncharacterized protein YoxC